MIALGIISCKSTTTIVQSSDKKDPEVWGNSDQFEQVGNLVFQKNKNIKVSYPDEPAAFTSYSDVLQTKIETLEKDIKIQLPQIEKELREGLSTMEHRSANPGDLTKDQISSHDTENRIIEGTELVEMQPDKQTEQADGFSDGDDQLVAVLLAYFTGIFGIHRFYLGYTAIGIIQLITLGGLGIWALVDFIRIITGDLKPNGKEYDRKI
jgi:TM2 domain-containing membrane protein YozV